MRLVLVCLVTILGQLVGYRLPSGTSRCARHWILCLCVLCVCSVHTGYCACACCVCVLCTVFGNDAWTTLCAAGLLAARRLGLKSGHRFVPRGTSGSAEPLEPAGSAWT
uniref:Secreted protein n=1 Tax=Ixodes ricinus TaxID=34613 RepID=A0A6B0UIC1_IXORI